MTKLRIVDLCFKKMLEHYSDHGMPEIDKPFEEVRQMIREERRTINMIKKLFKRNK